MKRLKICNIPLICLTVSLAFNNAVSATGMDDVIHYFDNDFSRFTPSLLIERNSSIIEHLSGLSIGHNFNYKIKRRGDLLQEYSKSFHEVSYQKRPEEQAGFEYTLRSHDFLAEEVKFLPGLVKLNYGDIAGYYDFTDKMLVLLDGLSTEQMEATLLHEMVHAGQDNVIGLQNVYDYERMSFDETLARKAVIEGQAQIISFLIEFADYDIDNTQKTKLLKKLSQSRYEEYVKDGTGEHLMPFKLFPYIDGALYVLAEYWLQDNREFSNMLKHLPKTTEQVLHGLEPGDYEYEKLTNLEQLQRSLASFNDSSIVYRSRQGEFYILRLFTNIFPNDEAINRSAAGGWADDEIVVFRTGDRTYSVWELFWDNETDVTEFVERYQQYLLKSSHLTAIHNSGSKLNVLSNIVFDNQAKHVLIFSGDIYDSERKEIIEFMGITN